MTAQFQQQMNVSEPQQQPEPRYQSPPPQSFQPTFSPSAQFQPSVPPSFSPSVVRPSVPSAPARRESPPNTLSFLPHPSSAAWQPASVDFLPPPPPPPILRSGGIQSQPKVAPPVTPSISATREQAQGTPRRMTRAAAAAAERDEATERNKYSSGGPRRKGGGVV